MEKYETFLYLEAFSTPVFISLSSNFRRFICRKGSSKSYFVDPNVLPMILPFETVRSYYIIFLKIVIILNFFTVTKKKSALFGLDCQLVGKKLYNFNVNVNKKMMYFYC